MEAEARVHMLNQQPCHFEYISSHSNTEVLQHWGRTALYDGRLLGNSWCCWDGFGYQNCLEVNGKSQIRAVSGRVPPSNTPTTSVALNMSLAQGEYNKVGRSRPRKMIHWL